VTPLLADSFSITLNVTSADPTSPIPVGTYHGSFTTNGCTFCTVPNPGGITSFHIPIQTTTDVVDFNALDTTNANGGALPEYTVSGQGLNNSVKHRILLSEFVNDPIYNFIVIGMSPTSLGAAPAGCDISLTTGQGCVSIQSFEFPLGSGTYTIDR